VDKRLQLHQKFLDILGTPYAYFQPPASIELTYPCIVYKRDKIDARYANDKKYTNRTRYQVTVIDPNPDSQLPAAVNALPNCEHLRNFVSDGLNHDILELYL
jgi:hypothetical protein